MNLLELKDVLKTYAALEVALLDECDGVDRQEKEGDIRDDDMVEDDNEDETEKEEDVDNCTVVKKEHFWTLFLSQDI